MNIVASKAITHRLVEILCSNTMLLLTWCSPTLSVFISLSPGCYSYSVNVTIWTNEAGLLRAFGIHLAVHWRSIARGQRVRPENRGEYPTNYFISCQKIWRAQFLCIISNGLGIGIILKVDWTTWYTFQKHWTCKSVAQEAECWYSSIRKIFPCTSVWFRKTWRLLLLHLQCSHHIIC